eukprot:5141900-Karenia_brevis.AAC.1
MQTLASMKRFGRLHDRCTHRHTGDLEWCPNPSDQGQPRNLAGALGRHSTWRISHGLASNPHAAQVFEA